MGACKSKGASERDLGGEEVTFTEDPVRELYQLFRADFALDNAEVMLLAAMVKSRRLDKLTAEAQALVVQREAMEQNCPRDYMIQRISEAGSNGNDVVISYGKFEQVITDCFEATDVQTAIDQMRMLQTQRQIQRYGTASVRVGRVETAPARRLPEAPPAPLPLARLYTAGDGADTSEEPTDEVPA